MPQWIPIIPFYLEASKQQACILQSKALTSGFPAHGHDYIEIELFLSGRGRQWVNNVEVPFEAGCLFLLSPEDYHRIEISEPAYVLSIHVQPQRIESMGLPPTSTAYFEALSRETFIRFSQMLIALSEPEAMQLELYEVELLMAAAQLLIELYRNGTVYPISASGKRLQKALKYIKDNCSDPSLCLKDAAEASALSPAYFSKLFKDIVGCCFVDYVAQYRLYHACHLLGTTNKTVTEIAYEVGFSGAAHFFRCFKGIFQCTPAEYRKTNHQWEK